MKRKNQHDDVARAKYIERWKAGLESGNVGRHGSDMSMHVRRYMLEKAGNRCSRCPWNEINPTTGRCPLAIDHIDGNWNNTVEANLIVLCPNCHSLTPTFGSLNRGHGRPRPTKL